ncbi:hypothetical protein HRQ91_10220 [Treponema parvum]|uniref:Lipoprotein-associated type-17 domain-containing protein n=1 Tax=Treponema parvum TaxID=138851 RepID=A0A975F5R5_9SPIR|nr:lipoprotein 17-related variable surface protein [Treponema parvum]QTQ14808.1 hypothetical protein HRQ91_10220 [Treponema parvum]
MKKAMICLLPVLLAALLTTGCQQAGSSSGAENPGINPSVPQNQYELVEADVLETFGLTKGRQSPFEAAGKITLGTSTLPSIEFTQKEVTAYNDEAGTFTVKVKGTKNGNPFDKEMAVNGFANPYASQPWSINSNDGKGELKLDEGIERNLSIEKYIAEAYPTIADFFKAPLTFSLANGTSVTLGDCDYYKLEATLAKEETDKIKIIPVYTVKNHKKTAGGSDTVTLETKYSVFHPDRFGSSLTKLYFTKKDVFDHVLSKTPDSVIKVDSNKFASSFYAFTKLTGTAPAELFDYSRLEPYKTLYQTAGADKYMQLDITCGVADPKGRGIDADDYKGELTVQFCIATHEQLANQEGSQEDPQEVIMAVRPITQSLYAKITTATELDNQLLFQVISKPSPKQKDIKAWKNKQYDNFPLLRVGDNGTVTLASNPLPDGQDKPFCLCVNGEATLSNHLGHENYGASKTINGKVIFVQSIHLQKTSGETDLQVHVQLKGSCPILTITTNPGPAYQ